MTSLSLFDRIRNLPKAALTLLAGVCLCVRAGAADPAAPPAGSSPASNAIPAVTQIPKSVFVVPASVAEGRDPFFPDSAPQAAVETNKTSTVTTSLGAIDFNLQGISGPADKKIAVINNRNLAEGETGFVPTAGGSIGIHVLEIKSNSVVIAIGDERRELRLRQTGGLTP